MVWEWHKEKRRRRGGKKQGEGRKQGRSDRNVGLEKLLWRKGNQLAESANEITGDQARIEHPAGKGKAISVLPPRIIG